MFSLLVIGNARENWTKNNNLNKEPSQLTERTDHKRQKAECSNLASL